jgi:formylglycine-generating enzyme required for sulfatase activity
MRLVPAGEFTRGNAVEKAFAECQKYRQDCQRNWFSDEAPARKIYLDAFYMDKYEVTNVLYKACVRAGLCLAPLANNSSTRTDYYDNATFDNYPVINIDWNMAKRYCEWRGGARLPTEAEWEKAARSTDERTFPWGEEINQNYANYNNYVGDTSAVGIYDRGKSADGIYDLAGNVWEWVSDRYSPTYYTNAPVKNPGGPDIGTEQVLRGGSWYYSGDILRSTNRSKDLQTVAGNSYGFRCVRPAP